jgi:hypothetical protein
MRLLLYSEVIRVIDTKVSLQQLCTLWAVSHTREPSRNQLFLKRPYDSKVNSTSSSLCVWSNCHANEQPRLAIVTLVFLPPLFDQENK